MTAQGDEAPTRGADRSAPHGPADHGRDAAEPTAGPDRSAQAAVAVFAAYLIVGSLVVLLRLGRDRWFFSDEWLLIAGRDAGSFDALFRANNAHWTTLPAIAYDIMWRLVGLRSYVPYQAMSVATHAVVVVLVRAVMRRSGVSPWMATALCAPIVIFGAGSDNLVWAFQITNTGAIAFGLAQLLLADRDGPLGRRDVLGLLAGLAAIMCSGIGVAMVASVGLAVLVRRGWRAAALHTVPLAITYLAWVVLADPQSASPAGRPGVGTVARWLVEFVTGTFSGLGGTAALGVVFAAVLVAGVASFVARQPASEVRRRLAAPGALAAGALVFSTMTALGRWQLGSELAAGSRYVYAGGVLVLPLVAVGAQELADRWRALGIVIAVLAVLAIPFGVGRFGDTIYGEDYFETHRRVVNTAAYVPFESEVPDDVRPLINPFVTPDLDMGFLRGARDAGDLDRPSLPLPARLTGEMRVRLGLTPQPGFSLATDCTTVDGPTEIDLEEGDQVVIRTPIDVRGVLDDGTRTPPVRYQPGLGARLVVVLDQTVEVRPPPGTGAATWCVP